MRLVPVLLSPAGVSAQLPRRLAQLPPGKGDGGSGDEDPSPFQLRITSVQVSNQGSTSWGITGKVNITSVGDTRGAALVMSSGARQPRLSV